MGVTVAPVETNNELRQALVGLEGVEQIQDDILVHGRGTQHDERLRRCWSGSRKDELLLGRRSVHGAIQVSNGSA